METGGSENARRVRDRNYSGEESGAEEGRKVIWRAIINVKEDVNR